MTSVQVIAYTAIAIASIIVYYFLARWIFEIPKQIRIQRSQLELLGKMAEKQGVPREEIAAIMSHADRG